MLYNDTTRRAHFGIRNEYRPAPTRRRRAAARFSLWQTGLWGWRWAEDRALILSLASRSGWGPERVSAHLRRSHRRRGVSPDVVRLVLARGNA